MCDIQILTGIGMLCSGFIVLPTMTIQAFDWAVIVQLSWFANLTHQSGLVFLRSELHHKDRQQERRWRVSLMTVLAVLLIVAMVPLAWFTWMDNASREYAESWPDYAWPARPAICFYTTNVGQEGLEDRFGTLTGSFLNTVTSMVILVMSFSTRLAKLFKTSSNFVQQYFRSTAARFCREMVMKVSQASSTKGRTGTLLLRNPFLAMYMLLRFGADFYTSTFSDVSQYSCSSCVQ